MDSRRYSNSSYSSSSQNQTGVKSKWIKAFRSLKLTAVGGSNRNNDLADLEQQKVYRISVQLGVHAFQEYTYKKITACDVCREILRGHSRQGLKCKLCKMNVHPGNCQENAPKCQPKPRLLRKQKSASELETKITLPPMDDEKYQNYDPVYQSLRATAEARKCAQYISEHYTNYNNNNSNSNNQSPSTSNNHIITKQDSFGSSGSISNQKPSTNLINRHQQQQKTGSNDSIVSNNSNNGNGSGSGGCGSGSLSGGLHQLQQLQQQQQRKDTNSCPPPPPTIMMNMQHRNSDSEFHQHQHWLAQQKQLQQQQQSEIVSVSNQQQQQRYYVTNHDNEPSPPPTTIRHQQQQAMYSINNKAGTGIPNGIQQQQHNQMIMKKPQHNSPALLTIAQTSHQAYSAPHSPQKKKLTLRMKSLSLDSPESAETLKDKRQLQLQHQQAFFSGSTNNSNNHLDYHHQQQQSSMIVMNNNEPPPLPSTMPPTHSLMQQHNHHPQPHHHHHSPPCYDTNEMINYQFKSSQQQNYQMSKRFKLGMHGRMRSFEHDDPTTATATTTILHNNNVQDVTQSCSMSPCPSPKPQRLLPTNIFVVLYNFRSRQADELNLRAGHMVTVVDTTDPDWWQGKCLGKVGYFPSKYVTKLFPGERPLQVIHTVQLTDGEFAIKLLREQIVIQVAEEMNGIIMVRTGINDKIVPCPSKYLQEIIY